MYIVLPLPRAHPAGGLVRRKYYQAFHTQESQLKMTFSFNGQLHEIFFKLRLWGYRLGPTEVPEPLFQFVYSPYNIQYTIQCYNILKMTSI